jgi:hypothetical protein
MLSDESKLKILQMTGKELFKYVNERYDLTPKQQREIYNFWIEQHEGEK